MKRVIAVVIAFFLICLVYEFGVLFFVKKYDYDYVFTKGKKEYKINEKYNYNDGKHRYDITIEDKDNHKFVYLISHNYHKDKEIVENLYIYENENTECIFPVFRDKVATNIVCNRDNKILNYSSLEEENNSFINSIKDDLIKKGYNLGAFTKNEETKEISNLVTKVTYYKDFVKNYNVLIWGYKGVFSINNKKATVNDFLKEDVYDTKYLTVGSKNMYVMDIVGEDSSLDKIYALNLKDGKTSMVDVIEMNISANSYFNGVNKNTVYFTDCNGNNQYKFTENNDNVEKIDLQGLIKYYDGKNLVNESVDDVANNYIYFNVNRINERITKLYNTSEIKESNGHYYYKANDGNFYLVVNNDYKNPILLFNKSTMNDWIVENDTIFGIIGNTLYAYRPDYGFKPLIRYDEFNYHTANMYGVIYTGE